MKLRSLRNLFVALVVLPCLPMMIGAAKEQEKILRGDEASRDPMYDAMLAVIKKWQSIPTTEIPSISLRAFSDALVIGGESNVLDTAQIQSLKETIFDLINSYNSASASNFIKFWEPYNWTLDKESGSYLTDLAGVSDQDPTNLITRAWAKVISKNQMTSISLTALKGEISWTDDAGALAAGTFKDDIKNVSRVALPPPIAMMLSRSVFDSKPLSSEIIKTDGRVLYARVLLFVKYSFKDTTGSSPTLPLELGLYWSPPLRRWVPHIHGSTSAVDRFGIIY